MPCQDCASVRIELLAQKEFMTQWFALFLQRMEISEAKSDEFRKEVFVSLRNQAGTLESLLNRGIAQETLPSTPIESGYEQTQQNSRFGIRDSIRSPGPSNVGKTSRTSSVSGPSVGCSSFPFATSMAFSGGSTTSTNFVQSSGKGIAVVKQQRSNDFEEEDEGSVVISPMPVHQQVIGEDDDYSRSSAAAGYAAIDVEDYGEIEVMGETVEAGGSLAGTSASSDQRSEARTMVKQHGKLSRWHHPGMSLLECSICCGIIKMSYASTTKHAATHLGLKPYKCPKCHYVSARKDNIRGHLKMVHKDHDTCPMCLLDEAEYKNRLKEKVKQCFGNVKLDKR